MRKQIIIFLTGLLLAFTLTQCNNKQRAIVSPVKALPNDPFAISMVPSQYFDIDNKQDTVVEGVNGTVIILPKGCFKNAADEIVEGNVKVELAEALSLDEMILSNLTTAADGKQLETDGMIYVNATLNGQPLKINKDNPIDIEIPTKNKLQGMMAYKGVCDEKGNMNWVDPKKLDNYLIPVDFSLLNFLPDGFQAEVEKGMPYKNHVTATQELEDSLYYSLAVSNGGELSKGLVDTHLNEPLYNAQKKIINGAYTKESYQTDKYHSDSVKPSTDTSASNNCGIDPALIKLLKSNKYKNTLISTREFEARLKVIFKACDNNLLGIYGKNTGMNLYELDSLAEVEVSNTQYSHDFHNFYLQKLTNVEGADKYAELLKGYYDKQLKRIKSELESAKEKLARQLNKKNEEVEKVAASYRKLLWEREKYRMEAYNFKWTDLGWVNIDKPGPFEKIPPQRLEINITHASQYTRVYVYAVFTHIKSIFRLNTDDNEHFYVGNSDDKKMVMDKNVNALSIAIAYKNDTPFIAIKPFQTGVDEQFTLAPELSTKEKLKETIKQYDSYEKENQISIDLVYMDKFFVEQQRQKALLAESEFIGRLWRIAYPCCQLPTVQQKQLSSSTVKG